MDLELKPAYQLEEETKENPKTVLYESMQPAYKVNDRVTCKGISGIITKIYKYTEEELLEAAEFPDIGWIQSHPFTYTMIYDEGQPYESMLLKKRYPNDDPSTWIKVITSRTFDFIDFENVKLIQ